MRFPPIEAYPRRFLSFEILNYYIIRLYRLFKILNKVKIKLFGLFNINKTNDFLSLHG